jgi:hypothetical protein
MEMLTASKTEIIDGFSLAAEEKRRHPDGGDPYIGVYAMALTDQLQIPAVQDVLVNIAKARETDEPGYILNLVLRGIQKGRLLAADDKYPDAYNTVGSWRELIQNYLVTDPDQSNVDMYLRSIQSNVDRRYVNAKFLALVRGDRINSPASILDFGASRNHGLNRLALNVEYPFEHIDVLESDFSMQKPVKYKIDKNLTANINQRYVDAPFSLGPSLGLDMASLRDVGNRLWVSACTFWPSEIRDKRRTFEYELMDRPIEGVDFQIADCTKYEEVAAAVEKQKNVKYDMVTISTMLYQMSDDPKTGITKHEKRRRVIENAKKFVKEDGFILMLDSVDKDADAPNGLYFPDSFYSNKRPFGYKVLVFDMLDPESDWQEMGRWENGRCKTLIPNMGNLIVSSALK